MERNVFGYVCWLCSTNQPKPLPRAEPDTRNAPDLAPCSRLRLVRSEVAIHEFGRHRHHDHSKNPAHHTTGSKLACRWVVLKFNSTPSLLGNAKPLAYRRTISLDVLLQQSLAGRFCSPP